MIRQLRCTGGIWFTYGGLNGIIDPGPGSLYHICNSTPLLDVNSIEAVLLTHKHLDHSTDINVIIEAITEGGFRKQGTLIIPEDAMNGDDSVLLSYSAQKVREIQKAEDNMVIELKHGVSVEAVKHVHNNVDCFGFILRKKGLKTWGIISDTKPLATFAERYKDCDYISVNTTFLEKDTSSEHMSIADTMELLQELHPKLATISHMGIKILNKGPETLAKQISNKNTRVIAGEDGMIINLDNLKVFTPVPDKKIKIKKYRII